MRKVILYIAMSLNGKIADENGGVEWLEKLPNPDGLDYGYENFYKKVDTTIMGNRTYSQIAEWDIDFPYPDKENFVFTTNQNKQDNKNVRFVNQNHVDFVKKMKAKEGNDIWLIGGGEINSMFLQNKLIDEICVFVMPILLTDGVDLFKTISEDTMLHLQSTQKYGTVAVELHYKLI